MHSRRSTLAVLPRSTVTAVVWSSAQNQYVLKTFSRSDPDIKAFLTSLGRERYFEGHGLVDLMRAIQSV